MSLRERIEHAVQIRKEVIERSNRGLRPAGQRVHANCRQSFLGNHFRRRIEHHIDPGLPTLLASRARRCRLVGRLMQRFDHITTIHRSPQLPKWHTANSVNQL
ncbi:hypothetical protein D9M69_671120 [compost metagenome]